jgi:hypothetical protein
MGSHGQAAKNRTLSDTHMSAIITPPIVSMARRCGRNRTMLISSPAMNAINAIASPLITCISRAIAGERMAPA